MLKQVPLPPPESLTPRAREFVNPYRRPWLRLANRALAPFATKLWPLRPEVLKSKAIESTGLSDFGTDAPLDEPLEILCRAMNHEADLIPMGRLSMQTQLVGNLVNRLRLEELARRRPRVFAEPVTAPVFIAGLNRSGTTMLQRLLAADPRWRTAPFWEVMNPLPRGDVEGPVPDPDPRIKVGASALRFVYWNLPDLVQIHHMENDLADEEIPILAISHASTLFEYMALVPEYVAWYTSTDHTAGYRYFKRFLQAMQWQRPGGTRWLLKSPSHLEMLRPLRTAFPDATVVQTHRDPVRAVVSLSSLVTYSVRVNFAHPNPHLIGQFATNYVERLLRASVRDRAGATGRYVDVHFTRLVEDPLREVRRVYAAVDAEFTPGVETAMRKWLGTGRSKKGDHTYTPEDFALDVAGLKERFGFYYERFGVQPE